MKSTATFALCALLCLGYSSRTRGDKNITVAGVTGDHVNNVNNTSPSLSTVVHTGEKSNDSLPQKSSPTLSGSAADSTPTSAKKMNESSVNGTANGSGSTDAPSPVTTSQSSTAAPADKMTNGAAVPTVNVSGDGTAQTGSAVVSTTSTTTTTNASASATKATTAGPPATPASAGDQKQDNDTLSSPPSRPASTTAGPTAITQPTKAKNESVSPTTITTPAAAEAATPTPTKTTPVTPHKTTAAAPTVSQSNSSSTPNSGHENPTSSSKSATTASPTTTTSTSSAKTTTTSSKTKSTITTISIAAPSNQTQPAAISELKVSEDGVPDPLLAGLVSVFVVAAAIVSLLVFLKFRKRNERPEFRRLQDLPMDDMMEDTPLSMYSY